MVYNSDTESEEGDPRYRVGSRFSSYHNEPKQVNQDAHHSINEDIKEVPKE